MWNLFKKKLHKRVLVCVGIPYTQDSFTKLYKKGTSDFIESLKKTYGTSDMDQLWKRYKNLADAIKKVSSLCINRGASVIDSINSSSFQTFSNFDIVIILAHHSEQGNLIEINGNLISEYEFTDNFPIHFNGILDLTSCYSTNLQYMLKAKCTSKSFHTIAVDNKTSLAFRILLLNRVIDELCTDNIDYLTAYQRAIDFIVTISPEGKNIKRQDVVYLGGGMKSTVFAPGQVCRGDSFIVQVFIHKHNENETVELMAKTVDESASARNAKSLPFKIKKNDKIEMELSFHSNHKDDFSIDKKRKSFIWTNEPTSLEFCVAVSQGCSASSFIGRIKIAINKQQTGDIIFKTNIVSVPSRNAISESIDFIPYSKTEEIDSESHYLFNKLCKELDDLNTALNNTSSDKERFRLIHEIDMCKKLFQILENNPSEIKQSIVKVFISSTSDLVKYRDLLKKQITNLKMYPVTYDTWNQEDSYPRDVCCKEVMASDIFVCILGANYGYIEPEWSMSMTEIEYRVAVKSGLPILVYILEDYEQTMAELSQHDKESVEKQKELIEELKSKRLVELFKNDLYLQMKSCEELTRLKTQLEFGQA